MLKLLMLSAMLAFVYSHFDGLKAMLVVNTKSEVNALMTTAVNAAGAQPADLTMNEDASAAINQAEYDEAKELVAARRRMMEERTQHIFNQF